MEAKWFYFSVVISRRSSSTEIRQLHSVKSQCIEVAELAILDEIRHTFDLKAWDIHIMQVLSEPEYYRQ